MTTTTTVSAAACADVAIPPQNPYISKWNILFDRKDCKWISFKPQVGLTVYPCYSCRDIFRSKNSFLDHINRRAVLLTYKCSQCNDQDALVFYNPCSFLLHTRQHYTSTNAQIDLENLEVSFLPLGLGGFLLDPNIPALYDVEDDNIGESMYISSRFYIPSIESSGNQIVDLDPTELIFLYSPKPKTTSISLILKQISSNIPRCQFVKVVGDQLPSLPNGGSGNNEQPASVDNDTNPTINNDLLNNCNEGDDVVTYTQCTECEEIHLLSSIKDHFVKTNKPYQESLKCKTCKYIAPTDCSLRAHERLHKSIAPYVCPECGKIFSTKKFLQVHMDEVCFHLAKQVRFRCPGRKCGKIFAQKTTFTTHFPIHVRCYYKCKLCNELFNTQTEFLGHSQIHENKLPPAQIYQCVACPEPCQMPPGQPWLTHIFHHSIERKQYVYVYVCKYCHSYFRSTLTYASHLRRCAKFFSNTKREQENSNANDFAEYLNSCPSPSADLRLNGSNCLLCNQQFLNNQEVNDHFRLEQCKFCHPIVVLNGKSNNKKKKSGNNSKRKRKRTFNASSRKNKRSESNVSMKPERPNGRYNCKLCKYGCDVREEFHEHIIKHRNVSTAYQCMECGECFVVKPSLMKHLLYFHHITNMNNYFNENNCFDKEAVKQLEEIMRLAPGESKGPVAKNQCRVCLEQFDSNTELNKHFRIHGMAFLLKNSK